MQRCGDGVGGSGRSALPCLEEPAIAMGELEDPVDSLAESSGPESFSDPVLTDMLRSLARRVDE